MDFGRETNSGGGLIQEDTIIHYINISWKNPSNANFDSTYIYQSQINDTTTAVKIKANV